MYICIYLLRINEYAHMVYTWKKVKRAIHPGALCVFGSWSRFPCRFDTRGAKELLWCPIPATTNTCVMHEHVRLINVLFFVFFLELSLSAKIGGCSCQWCRAICQEVWFHQSKLILVMSQINWSVIIKTSNTSWLTHTFLPKTPFRPFFKPSSFMNIIIFKVCLQVNYLRNPK